MVYKKGNRVVKSRMFKTSLQQHNRVFLSAFIRTVFVIRTTGFSHLHKCIPVHRLKSTVLSKES